MKIKTSELTGPALDWAVNQIEECCDDPYTPMFSTNWAQGGPIIERERIRVEPFSGAWLACAWNENNGEYHLFYRGTTPLIAAMRCFVSSRLGDEVDVPEEVQA